MSRDALMTVGPMLTRTPRNASAKDHLLTRGITLWRCIADDYEQLILLGKYENGSRLPVEVEIAAHYGVNRHTVRRAMAELAARGLVRSERGSGTYVETDKLDYRIGARTRFSEIVAAAGHDAQGRLRRHRIEPASEEIAGRLDLVPGTSVIRLEIVRAADRVPVSVATSWLCAQRFRDAAKIFRGVRSITKVLNRYGIDGYRRKWTRITAGFADAVDAGYLQLSVHRPILIADSVDVTADGKPILTTHGRFAADRVALVVES
jgi:GntR family transcriptional regulator, phosphonate transport system regulatory protein